MTDRQRGREIAGWSAETEMRLGVYAALLTRWQKVKNLVAPSTLDSLWVRHFADSSQVSALCPLAQNWLDLGSGAGFPGLVTAILLAERAESLVHLVESDKRKCAFLREVSRETGVRTVIHDRRIEEVAPELEGAIDAVSARALAPLPLLLAHSARFLLKGATGVFLKGQDVAQELTGVTSDCRFTFSLVPSRTDPRASVVIVKSA